MRVYEVVECEEYAWQISHGLFVSRELAQASRPKHTEVIKQTESICIMALPECAAEVRTARESREVYWWYALHLHGALDDGTPMFYGIITRHVFETLEDIAQHII